MLRLTVAVSLVLGTAFAAQAETITVTDLAGRTVTLEAPAVRVAIAEARQLVGLSLVDPDASLRIVGLGDTARFDREVREAYYALYPELAALAPIDGDNNLISAELTIAAQPDLVIMSGGTGPTEAALNIVRTLEAAGIPAIFIDFRTDPWNNTVPSIELLGRVLGAEEKAAEFVAFYEEHRDAVVERVAASVTERPVVFMHMQAMIGGALTAPGDANLGVFIDAAGGRNIGSGVVPGMFGPIAAEYLLTEDPDIYIGTGGTHFTPDRGIVAGPGVAAETAQASLVRLTAEPLLAQLGAVQSGNAYAFWHNFHNSPLNIIALEVLATWIHPELFADLDPAATAAEINERFLTVPFEGTAWAKIGE